MSNKSALNSITIAFSCIIVALYVSASGILPPTGLNWGFHFLGFLPVRYTVVFLLLFCLTVVAVLKYDIKPYLIKLSQIFEKKPVQFLAIASVIYIIVALIFRVKASLLGDSFTIIQSYIDHEHGLAPLEPWHEPFSMFFFYYAIKIVSPLIYPDVFWSFLSVELALGLIFIILLYYIVREIFSEPQQRFLAFLLCLTAPYMIFFFGYIEIYSFAFIMLALFILLSLLSLNGKIPFYLVPLAYVVLTFSHYVNGVLGISVAYLAYLEYRKQRLTNVIIGFGGAVILTLLILFAVQFDISRLIDISPISHQLSLTENVSEVNKYSQAYTLFSAYHFTDLLNYAVLMSPMGFYSIALCALKNKKSLFISAPMNIWFVMAIIPVAVYLFIAKLEQGFADDWDVFASHFLLIQLFAASLYFTSVYRDEIKNFTYLICCTLLFSLTWFLLNAKTEPSIQRFQALSDNRNVSQLGQYTMALRLTRYYDAVSDTSHQSDVWKKYRTIFPNDPRGYENEIDALNRFSPNSAIRKINLYEEWLTLSSTPGEVKRAYAFECSNAATDFYGKGNFDSSGIYYTKAILADSSQVRAYNNLGSIYAMQGKLDIAVTLFARAVQLDTLYSDAFYNLGASYQELGDNNKGLQYIRRAAELGNSAAIQALKEK